MPTRSERHCRPGLLAVLLLAAAALAPVACTGPARQLGDRWQEAVVPLTIHRSILAAPVRINDRTAGLFVVDTGAAADLVDDDVAARLGLPWVWEIGASGVGGKRRSALRQVESMEVGPVRLAGHVVGEIDFREISDALDVELTGCLGYSTLASAPFTLDYKARTLTFHRREAFEPPAGALELELRMMGSQPHVYATVDGRVGGWFILDTGYESTVTFESGFLSRHPELMPGEGAEEGQVIGIAGLEPRRLGGLTTLEVFGTALANVPAWFPAPRSDFLKRRKAIGTIGSGLMRHFRLTFDYERGRLWATFVGK